jgi:hypothetical protein
MNQHVKAPLPKSASEKLMRLADQEIEAQALMATTYKRIVGHDDALSYNPVRPDREAIVQEIGRLQRQHGEQQQRYADLARLNTALRDWLERLPANATVKAAPAVKVSLGKGGETYLSAVERVREAITTATKQSFAVHRAGLPAADQKAAVAAAVRDLAAKGKPKLRIDHSGVELSFGGKGFTTLSSAEVFGFLAWTDPDDLIERLEREIDTMPRAALELSPAEKAKRAAELRMEIENLERREEAIICRAADEGQIIARRINADPAAILGVIVIEEPKRVSSAQ